MELTGAEMTNDITEIPFSLGDIPDLSGLGADSEAPAPWADGWYRGSIVAERSFTDKNGNDRTFSSGDEPAQRSGRNIRLQVVLTRQDGRTLNTSVLVNYQPEDLTHESVQTVLAQQEKVKSGGGEWGTLFRVFMTLQRLSQLQNIAGIRQFQRSSSGGLDISPLYNKSGYFRLVPDDRNPQYKMVKSFQTKAPKNLL